MAAKDWLTRYGYVKGIDGRYRRPGKRTQIWEPTDGGWLRFEIDARGDEVQEIHSAKPGGASGLNKTDHPDAFNWVYSEAEVEGIYKVAVEAMPAPK